MRDCSGNAVPDGTIVTFTEMYDGGEATVDVPLKRGVARTEMPAYSGATISVATGVVLGNEIRWGKERMKKRLGKAERFGSCCSSCAQSSRRCLSGVPTNLRCASNPRIRSGRGLWKSRPRQR